MHMNKNVYVLEGVVQGILTPVEGFAFEHCFPPEIVANCVPCPEDGEEPQPGWRYADGVFSPPEPRLPPTAMASPGARIEAIRRELANLDAAKIRPLAAIAEGVAEDDDRKRLAELNAQTTALRVEMQTLEAEARGEAV